MGGKPMASEWNRIGVMDGKARAQREHCNCQKQT
jgi:hypothetical protein